VKLKILHFSVENFRESSSNYTEQQIYHSLSFQDEI